MRWWYVVCGFLLGGWLGCGDGDVDRTSPTAGSGGTAGVGGTAGSGGTTGTGGTAGAGGVASGVPFAERCASPGVIACWGFDTPQDTDPYLRDSGFSAPAYDGQTYAEGGGAIHMRVEPGSAADSSGSAVLDFSPGVGPGETLYLQWRQRFSASFIDTVYDANGWKQLLIHENTATSGCSDSEIVVTNKQENRDFPIVYHACNIFHSPVENPVDGDIWEHDLQPGGDNRCLYSWMEDGLDFVEPTDDVDELACIGYAPDQWMTFQLAVHIASWCTATSYEQCPQDSRFELWVTQEGGPTIEVIDWP
ncbi:MAG: hypothetical protein JRI23_03465, partial [Deltaproteobacteria bacterium]|nr:hypothetical protein [Deltaproteobacteria bacterium]MBW2530574.1 hypothetical protein [Deltaproteobacteria bacterium]